MPREQSSRTRSYLLCSRYCYTVCVMLACVVARSCPLVRKSVGQPVIAMRPPKLWLVNHPPPSSRYRLPSTLTARCTSVQSPLLVPSCIHSSSHCPLRMLLIPSSCSSSPSCSPAHPGQDSRCVTARPRIDVDTDTSCKEEQLERETHSQVCRSGCYVERGHGAPGEWMSTILGPSWKESLSAEPKWRSSNGGWWRDQISVRCGCGSWLAGWLAGFVSHVTLARW